MRYRPLIGATVAFAAGILTASEAGFLCMPLLVLVCFLSLLYGVTKRTFWLRAAIVTGFAVLGFFRYGTAIKQEPNNVARIAPAFLTVTGIVTFDVETIGKGSIVFTLRAEKAEGGPLDRPVTVVGEVQTRLMVGGGDAMPQYGDRVMLHGQMECPAAASNPGTPDTRAVLARRGIYAELFVHRAEDWRVLPEKAGNPLLRLAFALRHRVLRYGPTALSPPHGDVLNGILLGARGRLPADLREDFTTTGTGHILATAGLHVGIAVWLLLTLLRGLRIGKRPSHCVAIAVLLLFAFMAGGRPSVMRAVLVACLFLLGPMLEREPNWGTMTAFAALLLLIYNPCLLFDPGFQMSFVTVITLVVLRPFFAPLLLTLRGENESAEPTFSLLRELKTYVAGCIVLSLAAQIAIWPLAIYYGAPLSLISVPANITAVPLVAPIFALGFGAALLFGLFPAAAVPFGLLLNPLIGLLTAVVRFWGAQAWGRVNVPPPPVWFLWLYYGALWAACYHVQQKARKLRSGTVTAPATGKILLAFGLSYVLLFVGAKILFHPKSAELRVTFLDVGQGDAAVIETPGGKTVVMDTGRIDENGDNDSGRRVVAPFLQKHGVNKIDLLLLSHPHADHIGGATTLLEHFPVDLLMDNGQDTDSAVEAHYLQAAQQYRITYRAAQRGQVINLDDGVTIRVLSPTPEERDGPVNDASMVLRVEYGSTAFLFTGDAEINEESDILHSGQPLNADVLKVGHHGSVTSTTPEFLAAVHPKAAIISVGRRNLYGHPRREIIERLRASGIATFRTDANGAVTCVSDGTSVRVTPMHSPAAP